MKLQIIVGSTRQNRGTLSVAKWVANEARNLDATEVELVDLVDYDMPFFTEPMSPRFNPDRQPEPVVKAFITKIAEADAYVFVTPEYNHSIPAVLKNAIDNLTYEMDKKPATVVAHGSVGGARATMMLKEILSEARAAIIPSAAHIIGFPAFGGVFDDDGQLIDEAMKANPNGPQVALKTALIELKWYGDALATARTQG